VGGQLHAPAVLYPLEITHVPIEQKVFSACFSERKKFIYRADFRSSDLSACTFLPGHSTLPRLNGFATLSLRFLQFAVVTSYEKAGR
jgi:hypothetical protein